MNLTAISCLGIKSVQSVSIQTHANLSIYILRIVGRHSPTFFKVITLKYFLLYIINYCCSFLGSIYGIELTFGVNFPMTSITSIRGKDAHPFYKWAKLTYGTKTVPKWNFHKILIDKNGKVVETYSSMTKPTDDKVISKIDSLL